MALNDPVPDYRNRCRGFNRGNNFADCDIAKIRGFHFKFDMLAIDWSCLAITVPYCIFQPKHLVHSEFHHGTHLEVYGLEVQGMDKGKTQESD